MYPFKGYLMAYGVYEYDLWLFSRFSDFHWDYWMSYLGPI